MRGCAQIGSDNRAGWRFGWYAFELSKNCSRRGGTGLRRANLGVRSIVYIRSLFKS